VDSKVCLITGANSGIGKAAAVQLAVKGCHVVMACRNPERGADALADVRRESASSAVELAVVDMSLMGSVRRLAESLMASDRGLDVLIHNAADFDISRKERKVTDEGIETVWATNHLGPVLLTELVLDKLKASGQGRVLTVASKGLTVKPSTRVDVADPEFRSRKYSVTDAYYQSKIAQVMYTYWLAERLRNTGVTVNCVRVTNVRIDLSRYPGLSRLARAAYSLKQRFALSPEQMAETYTYLAVSPEVSKVTGKYFDEKNRIVSSSKYSTDPESIAAVMKLSMTYLGVPGTV
jgi:NAD(P)-dependent dehydrogenase (short-subunit alcohol dehydrogenase family)